jgi:organic hydroperoxide reductase OsmC/OhrA
VPKEHTYRVSTVWTGASQGTTSSYQSYSREYTASIEGKPPLIGSADPTFRGDRNLYNPEDLVVIALSACHMLSYLAICARNRIRVIYYSDEAVGKMAYKDGKMRITEVLLYPKVIIETGDDLQKAIAAHHQAHDECFIANSVAFPVLNEPVVLESNDPQASNLKNSLEKS